VTDKVRTHVTVTSTPTVYLTAWAKPTTLTETETRTKKTCSPTPTPPPYAKRDAIPEPEAEAGWANIIAGVDPEQEDEFLSNGERIRRGLPLNKPAQLEERHGGGHHGPKPSCVPFTHTSFTKTFITKTLTPTEWSTITKCKFTQTVDKVRE
jgi:hypothetical protein